MKSTQKSILLLAIMSLMIAITSCEDDGVTENLPSEIGEFTTEVFDDLLIEDFTTIETPFESSIASVAGGRTSNLNSTDGLVNALLEILTGAVLLELAEGEERGLPVYRVKLLLANKSILEVVIVKEIYEILEIEGHTGPFGYDIDPEVSFISLAEAFAIAQGNVDGEIVRWELELEEDNNWEYEIHIENENGRFEVEINAFTGELISTNKMDEEDKGEFEEEEEKEDIPEKIASAVATLIDGTILHAEKEQEDDRLVWDILVETASGAKVFLVVTDDTEDLIFAADEKGPFDYDLTIGEGFLSLKTTIDLIEEEMQSETLYWYFEQIDYQGNMHWAFIVKVKNPVNGKYHRVTVDAMTGEWLELEDFVEETNLELPENIANTLKSIITGEVVHAEKVEEGDSFIWNIYLKTESGAKVQLAITDATEDLIYAQGEEGPFDYELTIAEGFITFKEALAKTNEIGEVFFWEFDQIEINQENFWVFVIKVEGANGKFEITLNAQTGDLLEEEAID